ncbi:MAG TPA: hypothetical protein VE617_11425 [Propionibacteriaceae bacterium]|nr:hypothetical protein [Propionibacteriaceae bacterium]
MPGLPRPQVLARELSRPSQRWRSRSGSALFLESSAAGAGAFAPLEEALSAEPEVSQRVSSRLTSRTGTQEIHQQLLKGVPVVGATYKTVQSDRSSVLVGTPTADLAARDPGPRRPRSRKSVVAATREQLGLEVAAVSVQPVIFPLEGIGVWAYDVRLSEPQSTADVRAYVRESDLSLLYAHDVACAAVFAEGRVFHGNPGRSAQAQGVRLHGLSSPRGALSTGQLKVEPSIGNPLSRSTWDFRVDPADAAFDQVCAFHHMQMAAEFFGDIIGPDLFTDRPFTPLTVRVRDQRARDFVGLFKPDHDLILLDDGAFPAARSGDICVHEFSHAVAHRISRLGPFTSAIGRGLNEGFADYAQASLYDDPRFGDWVRQDPQGARRCDRAGMRLPRSPSDSLRDRYAVGEAWSCLLWDLRTAVGPGVADAIAFHSLQYLSPSCDYPAARAALHQADAELFPQRSKGRHRRDIDAAFAAREPEAE